MAEDYFFPDPPDNNMAGPAPEATFPASVKTPPSLEDCAILSYLKYLEAEVVGYIGITQSDSQLLKGIGYRMIATLKYQLNSKMSGLASSVIRQKMLRLILSDAFPSPNYCNMEDHKRVKLHRDVDEDSVYSEEGNEDHPFTNCPNSCCTGAFIKEAMAGIVMSADIHELFFTSDVVKSRRHNAFSILSFNTPVVMTHLLSATHHQYSQLERLVFTENFVKEDTVTNDDNLTPAAERLVRHYAHAHDPYGSKTSRRILMNHYRKQEKFAKSFAAVSTQSPNGNQSSVYCSADRRGLALALLVMFRDVAPRAPLSGDLVGFYKLTEIVLKNNVQCQLYSKANFQFELLARIGFGCPRLKVLDLFGTDTWADCLVAFFFRDAFHSLHRYLFFMENEEDEDSAYHPHDLSRYCQFCFDRLQPVAVERPFTINPVIPLIDPIYDHVIKKYPKRSYCILRNCVKVSDLIECPKSTVFELLRPNSSLEKETDPLSSVDPLSSCQVGGCLTKEECSDEEVVEVIDDCDEDQEEKVAVTSIRSRLRSASPSKRKETSSRGTKLSKNKDVGENYPVRRGKRQRSQSTVPLSIKRKKTDGENEPETKKVGKDGTYTILSHNEKPITVFPIDSESECKGSERRSRSNKTASQTTSRRRSTRLKAKKSIETSYKDKGLKTSRSKIEIEKEGSNKPSICNLCTSTKTSKKTNNSSPSSSKDKQRESQEPSEIMTRSRSKQRKESAVKPTASQETQGSYSKSKEECLKTITFEEWQKENNEKWKEQQHKHHAHCSREKCQDYLECFKGPKYEYQCQDNCSDYSNSSNVTWAPRNVQYREISGWSHLNDCIKTLEMLNIGGTNVLGEFIPFILLYTQQLKSMGQWINTMIYGLEILRSLPGNSTTKFPLIQEFSYSTDRNYFCQPYIGFVPESAEYKNVRKEMVRQTGRVAKRLGHSVRNHTSKRKQIEEDINLMVDACPNCHKLNLVLHHKQIVLDDSTDYPWAALRNWSRLKELDLVTMRFSNVRSLLRAVGPKLESLTLEMDDEQGHGSEIVHIARHCSELKALRLLIGDKILKGEMTLHFGTQFFRRLERLTVEGSVHLHGFAFLWGHCKNLSYLKIGNVVSNEATTSNVLIYDVFTLLFQVNKMSHLEEMHIKNLKIRTLQFGKFLLDNLPRLKKASNWILDFHSLTDQQEFKHTIRNLKESQGLNIEFSELQGPFLG